MEAGKLIPGSYMSDSSEVALMLWLDDTMRQVMSKHTIRMPLLLELYYTKRRMLGSMPCPQVSCSSARSWRVVDSLPYDSRHLSSSSSVNSLHAGVARNGGPLSIIVPQLGKRARTSGTDAQPALAACLFFAARILRRSSMTLSWSSRSSTSSS